jgi:hypothetical protein
VVTHSTRSWQLGRGTNSFSDQVAASGMQSTTTVGCTARESISSISRLKDESATWVPSQALSAEHTAR